MESTGATEVGDNGDRGDVGGGDDAKGGGGRREDGGGGGGEVEEKVLYTRRVEERVSGAIALVTRNWVAVCSLE